MYKQFYKLGFVNYLALLILSVVFYKERTVFVDIAYHLFFILKDDAFAIQNFRFGAVVTQVFPFAGQKLSLDLNTIAIMYSVGFILYYGLCYAVCGSLFKSHRFATVSLLTTILFVSHTFFWMQSELPQGLAFMVVFFAFLGTQRMNELKVVPMFFLFLSIVTLAFFHPLLVFPFLFVVLFFLLSKEEVIDKRLLYVSLICYGFIYMLKKYVFVTSYDAEATKSMERIFDVEWLRTYSNKQFLLNCLTKYYWIPIISAGVSIFYFYQRSWLKLILFVSFVLGYLFLINVLYQTSDTKAFYIENLYLPLGIFLSIPFVFDIMPLFETRKVVGIGILGLIIISGTIRICDTGSDYTSRLNWERKFLADNNGKKMLVYKDKAPADLLLMNWGTPYEFWLLSTIENGKSASVIISDNGDDLLWAVDNKKAFIATWGLFPYDQLPNRYFKFFDTTSSYIMVK